jgi:hypothetical protein
MFYSLYSNIETEANLQIDFKNSHRTIVTHAPLFKIEFSIRFESYSNKQASKSKIGLSIQVLF